MENNVLNTERLFSLIKRKLILNRNSVLIAVSAVAGILLILFYIISFASNECDYQAQYGLFCAVFFICGYIFSGTTFAGLGKSTTGYQYLTLPASNLEKLITGWLYSSVLYSLISFVLFIILSTLACSLSALQAGFDFVAFNININDIFRIIGIYMVTQTVFLFGSTTFKKRAFIKTLLFLFLFSVTIYLIVIAFGMSVIYRFAIFNIVTNNNQLPFTPELKYFFENTFPLISKILFWYVIAPFFMIVSYFKLKEREI